MLRQYLPLIALAASLSCQAVDPSPAELLAYSEKVEKLSYTQIIAEIEEIESRYRSELEKLPAADTN